ncbi:MAG: hypothetical protein ACLRQX_06060 [Turicibacter sanguinis]
MFVPITGFANFFNISAFERKSKGVVLEFQLIYLNLQVQLLSLLLFQHTYLE